MEGILMSLLQISMEAILHNNFSNRGFSCYVKVSGILHINLLNQVFSC